MNAVEFRFRPLSGVWQDDGLEEYQTCRFRASYRKTLDLLTYEMIRLGVGSAVIEMDVSERDIRLDGLPRAHARPDTPRVRLSFEHPKIGPLQYPCDTFADYRDNLRAIAKTLEAQRAMDRYGATRRSQQYRGWRALPPRAGGEPETRVEAASVIARYSVHTAEDLLAHPDRIPRAGRQAQHKTHPDRGGSAHEFYLVQEAIRTLGGGES